MQCRLCQFHNPTPFPMHSKHKYLAVGKHLTEVHGSSDLLNESYFKVLKKCQSKFDCLVFEMLYIKRLKPNLNARADSICAEPFV